MGIIDDINALLPTNRTGVITPDRLREATNLAAGWSNGGDGSGMAVTAQGTPTARTMAQRAGDIVNVKDFGAKGDGIHDDAVAFFDAHGEVAAGAPIHVTDGTFRLGSNVMASRRHFILHGATLTGPGKLVGALIERIDQDTGARSFGVGSSRQYGSYYRFGRNAGGPIGLVIGGGDPDDGTDGNVVYPDVYSGWTAIMPTRWESAIEVAVQPASSAGRATATAGTNVVARVYGENFTTAWVGRRFYLGDWRLKVASVNVVAQTLTVTDTAGGAVSFPSTFTGTYIVVGVNGSGICNVNGTTVTRVSGDPFCPPGNAGYLLKIDGVERAMSAAPDFDTLTLSTPAGTLTNVPYEFYTSVDNLSSAIRVHRVAAPGFEENLSLGAYADGYYHIHAASSAGLSEQRPLFIGSGYSSGGKRKHLALQANGDLTLGGDYDRFSLIVKHMDDAVTNGFFMSGGSVPVLRATGDDADIPVEIGTKGWGSTRFTSGGGAYTEFEVIPVQGSSWLAARSDSYGAPRLAAVNASGTGDIDIWLKPQNNGRVLIGPHTAASDAPVTGYILVKDSGGATRKLAVIA